MSSYKEIPITNMIITRRTETYFIHVVLLKVKIKIVT